MIKTVTAIFIINIIAFPQQTDLFFAGIKFSLNNSLALSLSGVDTTHFQLSYTGDNFVVIYSKHNFSEYNESKLVGTLSANESNRIIKISKHWGSYSDLIESLNIIHHLLNNFSSLTQSISADELIEPDFKSKYIYLKNDNETIEIDIHNNSIQIWESIEN